MKRLIALFIVTLFAACNANTPPEKIEGELKAAMLKYLYKENLNNDSSKVKFRIENLFYYDEKVDYICEFKVRMLMTGRKDTVGAMHALISKDFVTVKRTM